MLDAGILPLLDRDPEKVPAHILVFIPGYMGSRLRNQSSGELVWLDIPDLLRNPAEIGVRLISQMDELKYPNSNLVPDGIVDEVLFLPPFIKQEQYGRLIAQLTDWGYRLNPADAAGGAPSLFTFAYDWRQDNRSSARQLARAIDEWRSSYPKAEVWIMGHSNGGIVARWYIEKEGGKEVVSRLFLLASPWDGAPKALQVMQDGLDVFLLRYFNRFGIAEKLRETALTFPSFYQLIPSFLPFLRDANGATFDLFHAPGWLETSAQVEFLEDARAFNRDLGTQLSVDTCCFFGVKLPTTTRGTVNLTPEGRFLKIDWEQTEDGDGTVPVHSALHPNAAQKLPYPASHGDLYVHDSFVAKLKYELIDRYRFGALASVATSRLKAQFQTDQDVYSPGEPIHALATVQYAENSLPVDPARIEIRVERRSEIPYFSTESSAVQAVIENPPVIMQADNLPGTYRARINAPQLSGYYTLKAVIYTLNDSPVRLDELILVDLK